MPPDSKAPGADSPEQPYPKDIVALAIDRLQAEGMAGVEALITQHPHAASLIRHRLRLLESAGMLEPAQGDVERVPERIGEYRIVRRLGSGGMGVVFLAEQVSLRRSVALKLIRPENLYFPGARERFRREVETIARLQHPGIVRVYAAEQDGELPYFTMEPVEGVSLDHLLRRLQNRSAASLTERDVCDALRELGGSDHVSATTSTRPWLQIVCRWLHELTDAVAYAHRHNVVHRDLKPSNVMITWSLRPMLLDFGLARSADSSSITRSGVQLGSLLYMAPEQVLGGKIDARTDVYALGLLFYELLTLRNPFHAASSSDADTRQRIVAAAAPAARVVNAAVSWDAETVCRCAMAPEPEQRYASAVDLGRDLQNLLESRPILARRAPAALRLRRYARRHPARTVACVMGGLLLLATPTAFAASEYRLRHEITRAKDDAEGEAATRADILRFFNEELLGAVAPDKAGKDATMRQVLDIAAKKVVDRFPDRPLVEAEIRATLGKTYAELGDLEVAKVHLARALALYEQHSGTCSRTFLQVQRKIGSVLSFAGQLAEHEALLRSNLEVCRREFGEQDPDAMAAAHGLGLLLTRRGKNVEAEQILLEVVQTRLRTLGEDHSDTQASMSNLGVVYYTMGRYRDAEPWVKRELDLCRKKEGDDHPSTLISRHNYANLLGSLGRLHEAVTALESIVPAERRVFGDRHPETRNAMGSLAKLLSHAKRHAEALTWFDEVLRCSDDLSPDDPNLLYARVRRADVLRALGRLDDAAVELDASYRRCHDALGPQHAITQMAQRTRADLWIAQGRRAEAADLVAALLAEQTGTPTGQVAHQRLRHASNLRMLGRYADAEEQVAAAHQFFGGANVGDPALRMVYEEFVALTEATGRADEAATWRERLREWRAAHTER